MSTAAINTPDPSLTTERTLAEWVVGADFFSVPEGIAPAQAVVLPNNAMACAHDICDFLFPGQHVGISLVPVAPVMAEEIGGCSGRDVLAVDQMHNALALSFDRAAGSFLAETAIGEPQLQVFFDTAERLELVPDARAPVELLVVRRRLDDVGSAPGQAVAHA